MNKARNKSIKEIRDVVKQYVNKEITGDDVIDLLPNEHDLDKFLDVLIVDYFDEMVADEEDLYDI